jgi:AcrR family transcriptional regulator
MGTASKSDSIDPQRIAGPLSGRANGTPAVEPFQPARQTRLSGEQRRASIAAAATEVFAKRGYEGARIEEVAAAAGVSKALIYEHYDGKRELYAYVMRRGTEESLDRVLGAAGEGKSSVSRMQRGLGAFLDYVAENPTVWRVIEQEASDPEIIALDQSQQRRSERAIAELLASDPEICSEDLPPEQIEVLAVMINGASVRAANWWLENPSLNRNDLLIYMMRFLWLGLQPLRRASESGSGSNGSKA